MLTWAHAINHPDLEKLCPTTLGHGHGPPIWWDPLVICCSRAQFSEKVERIEASILVVKEGDFGLIDGD